MYLDTHKYARHLIGIYFNIQNMLNVVDTGADVMNKF